MRPEDTQMASGRAPEPDIVERLREVADRPDCTYPADMGKAADEIERLRKRNNAIMRQCDPYLTSADLKAVDRHCDWEAFGHAYRAMLNVRAALAGKEGE